MKDSNKIERSFHFTIPICLTFSVLPHRLIGKQVVAAARLLAWCHVTVGEQLNGRGHGGPTLRCTVQQAMLIKRVLLIA